MNQKISSISMYRWVSRARHQRAPYNFFGKDSLTSVLGEFCTDMWTRSLSKEEEAELARINKKVKDVHHASFNEGELSGFGEKPSTPKISFKDKLVGEIPGAYSWAFLFSNHMDVESDFDDKVSKLMEGLAAVKLKQALICKYEFHCNLD